MTESKKPWLLWGNSQTLKAVSAFTPVNNELACIHYHRPETWTFLFEAKLLACNNANLGSLNIDFNLSLGVGRSQTLISNFEQFVVSWPIGGPPIGLQFWSTSVIGPPRSTPVVDTRPNVISEIPASDIDCISSLVYVGGGPTDAVTIEVSAYFAPKTHLRPDWFVRDFNGGELEGE